MNDDQFYAPLKKYFGYDSFRSFQKKAIQKILDQQDILTIMPTGGGKSLIFQLAAVLSEGMAIVISPLIALMKDQVSSLEQNGISAACINSSLSENERKQVFEKISNNEIKLLYISPEKLLSEGFLEYLKEQNISFFAIDEAHCISSWGHDFRPGYIQLNILKRIFPNKSIVALTATADKQTRTDIANLLSIPKKNIHMDSFDRANLSLNVLSAKNRYKRILNILNDKPFESGIIYCLSRKSTQTIAEKLQKDGFKAGFYHAGLSSENRNNIQEKFANDELQIICATIAFGMGIDKSNIRWVIHYNLPKNMEAYYQEIGRAGRDGLEADTYLFYSYGGIILLKQFAMDSGQSEIQLAKLESMQKYAEAQICRRKILLSYFNELLEEDCGNCDVCANPPKTFDGTVLAQKALSASKRTGEFVAVGMLIDILRGSGKREVYDLNYNQLKTFGVGKDVSWFDWQQYLLQFIHIGLFEIDFANKQRLRITDFGSKVLFGKKRIEIVAPKEIVPKKEISKKLESKTDFADQSELFESLRIKRKEIAIEKNMAAYLIFSDKSLKDMMKKLPTNNAEMLNVTGVGENKLHLYGDAFITVVLQFLASKKPKSSIKKGKKDSHLESFELFKSGKNLADIAKERNLTENTILGHFIKCYLDNMDIDLYEFITKQEVAKIIIASQSQKEEEKGSLKVIFSALNEQVSYGKIKIALALSEEK